MEKKVNNIDSGVKSWVQWEIRGEIRSIKTWFDGFKRRINQKLADLQSLDLKGIHEDLATLRATIEDIYSRPFSSMPIIEEIHKEEEILNI